MDASASHSALGNHIRPALGSLAKMLLRHHHITDFRRSQGKAQTRCAASKESVSKAAQQTRRCICQVQQTGTRKAGQIVQRSSRPRTAKDVMDPVHKRTKLYRVNGFWTGQMTGRITANRSVVLQTQT
jgi:hypothetical protein